MTNGADLIACVVHDHDSVQPANSGLITARTAAAHGSAPWWPGSRSTCRAEPNSTKPDTTGAARAGPDPPRPTIEIGMARHDTNQQKPAGPHSLVARDQRCRVRATGCFVWYVDPVWGDRGQRSSTSLAARASR